jgi:hypothetical protein
VQVRKTLEIISKAYDALSSEEKLRNFIGDDNYNYFYDKVVVKFEEIEGIFGHSRKSERYDFLKILEEICKQGQTVESFSTKEWSCQYLGLSKIDVTRFQILRDIFRLLDNKTPRLPSLNTGLKKDYQEFLNTLFAGVEFIEQTYGLGHQNLFVCVYFYEMVVESLTRSVHFNESGPMFSDVNEVAEWIKRSTGLYECQYFSNKNIKISLTRGRYGDFNDFRPEVEYKISLLEREYEELSKEGNEKNIEMYVARVTSLFEEMLRGNITRRKGGGLLLGQSQIKTEYRMYRKLKADKKISPTRIVKRIDGVPNYICAILAWDYYHGVKAPVDIQLKIDEAILEAKRNEGIQQITVKESGVKKWLTTILSDIKSDKYKEDCKEMANLTTRLKGDYFPYPLFFGSSG